MNNLQLPSYLSIQEIAEGNNLIAEFMPDMRWHIPPNPEYPPYWRQFDSESLIRKDYTAGHVKASNIDRFLTLGYHNDWNRLKKVIDRIFTYSLAYPDQTERLRKTKIVVDIIPAWEICVEFAKFYKSIQK